VIEAGVTLAIESAVAGGSLSLLDPTGREIESWVGSDTNVARAEDLIVNIDALLSTAGLTTSDLGLIAVSAGPGSFTGIRIGIATALGLKNGLGIPMSSSSVLGSIVTANVAKASRGLRFCSVVPSGRGAVSLGTFELNDGTQRERQEPRTIPASELTSFVAQNEDLHFLVHSDLFADIPPTRRVTDIGRNLARFVGLDCLANRRTTAPVFLSKSF
jgi:tRNA threonylcarbamoyladenosine biosynthesis protein TsaB